MRPGSQTSPRAAGLTNTKAASTEIMARLTDEATETLAHFERETGIGLDFHRSGQRQGGLHRGSARPACWPTWTWRGRSGSRST